jgi:hypothetical protein
VNGQRNLLLRKREKMADDFDFNPATVGGADGEMHDKLLSVSDGLAVTDIELKRKLFFCIKTLRIVQEDLGYMSLDETTRKMIEEARTPIGGWEAGLARIKAFLDQPELKD